MFHAVTSQMKGKLVPVRCMPFRTIGLAFACLLLWAGSTLANPIPAGDPFPAIRLSGNPDAGQKEYLGLTGEGPWTLADVKGDYLLIEVFSMYCPHCQAEAPSVNDLYAMMRDSKHTASLKMLGIGAGNSAFEVDFFKQKYGVGMPLFEDAELELHTIMGQPGTPHFFLLKRKGTTFTTLYSETGRMESPEAFFKMIVKKAGL